MRTIALILLLSGCSIFRPQEPAITLHAQTTFTRDERTCLAEAADQWRDQTGGYADVELVYDYRVGEPKFIFLNRLARWTSDMPEVKAADQREKDRCEDSGKTKEHCADYGILGQVNGNGGLLNQVVRRPLEMRLVVDRVTAPGYCKLTAMHEFGHVFGMGHGTKPESIMYPSIQPRSDCLKTEDLNSFCSVNDCGTFLMSPCDRQ